MAETPVPQWYLTMIQYYLLPLVQVVFWITVPLILYGALKQLRRLVDVYADYDMGEFEEDFEDDLDDDVDDDTDDDSDIDTSGSGTSKTR